MSECIGIACTCYGNTELHDLTTRHDEAWALLFDRILRPVAENV